MDRIADDDGHTLVVDDVLWGKYDDQLYNPAHFHTERGPLVRIRLWELMRRIGKIDGLGHTAPPFPEEDDIPQGSQDDKFIVRLAVEETGRGTALVTTDRPLREDLSSCGIQARYGLLVRLSQRRARPALTHYRAGNVRPMTAFASSSGMLLATAQGAVSARIASVSPDSVCFLYRSSYSMPRARPTSVR
jgi:hypothetical protein